MKKTVFISFFLSFFCSTNTIEKFKSIYTKYHMNSTLVKATTVAAGAVVLWKNSSTLEHYCNNALTPLLGNIVKTAPAWTLKYSFSHTLEYLIKGVALIGVGYSSSLIKPTDLYLSVLNNLPFLTNVLPLPDEYKINILREQSKETPSQKEASDDKHTQALIELRNLEQNKEDDHQKLTIATATVIAYAPPKNFTISVDLNPDSSTAKKLTIKESSTKKSVQIPFFSEGNHISNNNLIEAALLIRAMPIMEDKLFTLQKAMKALYDSIKILSITNVNGTTFTYDPSKETATITRPNLHHFCFKPSGSNYFGVLYNGTKELFKIPLHYIRTNSLFERRNPTSLVDIVFFFNLFPSGTLKKTVIEAMRNPENKDKIAELNALLGTRYTLVYFENGEKKNHGFNPKERTYMPPLNNSTQIEKSVQPLSVIEDY